MPIPSREQLLQPTLDALHQLDGVSTNKAIDHQVIQSLRLAPEDIAQLSGDTTQTELEYRLAWVRTNLKYYGLIDNPKRGAWTLTERGRATEQVDPETVSTFVRELMKQRKADNEKPADEIAGQIGLDIAQRLTKRRQEATDADVDLVAGAPLFVAPPDPYDRQDFQACTYLRDEQADDLYDLLLDKKQIILYGPPGTGKTYVAQELAKWITGLAKPPADRVEMIQFHPAYSYEDFIEGIRPESKQTGDGHFTVDYPPRPGVFRRFCRIAQENPDQAYVFVIDEINRGNIPRIFGELMLLLEYRERDVPLPYSGERFRIPPNVYLIGTMNTADRSIALVDFALRRRFHFFQFGADPDLLERWLAEHPVPIPYLAKLYRRLSQEAIDDPAYAVGVSYFMDKNLTEAKLARIWRHSIIPYLAEYHVEQRARVKNWEWNSEFMVGIRGEG